MQQDTSAGIGQFIEHFLAAVDFQDPVEVTAETVLAELPEWDSLAALGVTTKRDGTVTLDTKKLDAAIKAYPDAVEAIFVPLRDATHTETTDPGIGSAMATLKTSETADKASL